MKMTRSEAGKLGSIASRAKQKELHAVVVESYNKNPTLCDFCEKPLSYPKRRNKFCNHSCAAKRNNIDVVRNFVTGALAKKSCLNCGKITANINYCSAECCSKHKWMLMRDKILLEGKIPSVDWGYGYNPTIAKRFIAETRGRQCEICNGKEWMGKPIPLVLDHVDGNPDDHRIENIRLVCGNCNMQLPTFAGRNIGKGRKWRKSVFNYGVQ